MDLRGGNRSYEMDLQEFSHFSEEDFVKKYLGLLPPFAGYSRKKRAALSPAQCRDVPTAKNWKDLNRVSYVKDQKECGSCYIFSSTGAVESAVAIEYGIEPIDLSRQHLLNCINAVDTGNQNGCRAGRPEWIWKYSKDEEGLVPESEANRYVAVAGECDEQVPKADYSEVDYWERVPFTGASPEIIEEQIKCRLATTGPLHVGMTVKKDDLGSFKSGVFKDTDGLCVADENVNHGLLLVGYGEKLLTGDRVPTKFWILQNSWGERWGEQGYLNVERGKNVCGFAKDAYFPVLKATLKPIDKPAVCKDTLDIFDGGKYAKSLCLIEQAKTYEDSQRFCLENEMRLFRTDSRGAREKLLSFANKEWSDRADFTPFISTNSEDLECKSIVKEGDKFGEDGTDCADESPSICEFVNKSPEAN